MKRVFQEIGIGEVTELKKGFLDSIRLPGVTNGTWSMRVKIADPEKAIPSYIHRRDEGELWSLNFEGRVFCCWKCGSPSHIGDKCRDQNRTFEEIFNGEDSQGFVQPTWAAVVRSRNGDAEDHRKRVMETEAKIRAENIRKNKVISDALALEKKKELEAAAKKAEDEKLLHTALKDAEMVAKEVT